MTPRAATLAVFFVHGAVLGTWVASIPGTQAALGMSASQLGLVLLLAALGSLIGQQVTGQLLVRHDSRRIATSPALAFPLVRAALSPGPGTRRAGCRHARLRLCQRHDGPVHECPRRGHRGAGRPLADLHAARQLVAGRLQRCGRRGAATALGVATWLEAVVVSAGLWVTIALVIRRIGTGSRRTEGASGIHLPSRRALPLALLIIPVAFAAGA